MTSKFSIENRELLQRISSGEAVVGIDFGNLIVRELAAFRLAAMDSESGYLPLDYLHGHKDGLEWATQLAEANHPERGDWLYDDLIELAKAIRKGPDMPPVQPVADSEPVAEITEDLGRLFVKIHYPTTLRAGDKLYRHAQPAPVVSEEMTPEMMRSVQLNSELGAYAASNLSGAYDLFAEFWKEACRAAMLNHPEQRLDMVDYSGDVNEKGGMATLRQFRMVGQATTKQTQR